MFTGIVQTLGVVLERADDSLGGATLRIGEPRMAPELILGESVAVNGVCLSVAQKLPESFLFQVGPETLRRTNLGRIQVGERVNLEQALRVGDRLGGHFVSGHIDTVGRIVSRSGSPAPDGWETVFFEFDPEWSELLVEKGSIAIDGVSLTVVDVEPNRLSVMLIPLTLAHSTLGFKKVGDEVNLEFDLIAKHVRKLYISRGNTA